MQSKFSKKTFDANYVVYKNYAGIKIKGTERVFPPTGKNKEIHMQRAFYLTAQLESPTWGTVQSYDGCGMSGGPMHWIAVMPQFLKQGELFKLIYRIELMVPHVIAPLRAALKKHGYHIAVDGKLRLLTNGQEVSARDIRNLFTPVDGKVPQTGPERKQAEYWAGMFHEIFADSEAEQPQIDYSIEYLVKGCKDVELKAYRLFLPQLGSPELIGTNKDLVLPEAVDLAMSVYHSFSPNAPSKAKECLEKSIWMYPKDSKPSAETFATSLIRNLGKHPYGKWQDTPGIGSNRYDSCRVHAKNSKLWDEKLFTTVFPVDLRK